MSEIKLTNITRSVNQFYDYAHRMTCFLKAEISAVESLAKNNDPRGQADIEALYSIQGLFQLAVDSILGGDFPMAGAAIGNAVVGLKSWQNYFTHFQQSRDISPTATTFSDRQQPRIV